MTTKETKRLYAALYAHWLRALHSMLIDACLATPDDETRQLSPRCAWPHLRTSSRASRASY